MYKHLYKLKIFLIFLIIFAIFYSITASQEEEVIFISYNQNSHEIVDDLYNQGFIGNKFNYYIVLLLSELYKDIEPGGYSLKKSMGALALHAKLSAPDYRYVTIGEGLRKEQVAEIFASKLDWNEEKKESFNANLPLCFFTGGEGYFFPGKYLVHKDESVDIIKKEMYQRLKEQVEEFLGNPEKNIINLNQVVTIASLIQKEAADKNDMRLISGIIWNRLFDDMPLQIDATLQYVKGEEDYWWPMVRSKDKFLDSPYNTYKNRGLPPGPIASPGIEAIMAALEPSDTNCVFYLHDRSRNIHCSSTYDGHKKNISYYLR